MKRLLFLLIVSLMLTGCVAVPVYDSGYYYPYYGPHPYYVGPEVNFFVPAFHGGHTYYGGHDFRSGYGFRGGSGFRGGQSFRGGRR